MHVQTENLDDARCLDNPAGLGLFNAGEDVLRRLLTICGINACKYQVLTDERARAGVL